MFSPAIGHSQGDTNATPQGPAWTLHGQLTTITQWHYAFSALYSGRNSFNDAQETEASLTSTAFIGARLWPGGEVYLDPELSAGSGLSGTLGIAGFPNGEIYRVAESAPRISVARFYLRQIVGLSGEVESIPEGVNQIAERVRVDRLTFAAGKFSLTDFFDDNTYSHDARTQFLNWSVMSMGAWDYAADTRGYTWGVFGEYRAGDWSLRAAAVLVPKEANQLELDTRIGDANSVNIEVERRYTLAGQAGTSRFVFYRNLARMGNYDEATSDTAFHTDITLTRQYSRTKFGVGLNLEQQLSESGGVFARLSWNDGRNETWAFTEIDRSFCIGIGWKGTGWNRPDDAFGTALAINGISDDHRRYLSAGGYGFIIGDGRLNYGGEMIVESYYSARILRGIAISADYQFVANPAYNRDRGPVHIFAVRLHSEL